MNTDQEETSLPFDIWKPQVANKLPASSPNGRSDLCAEPLGVLERAFNDPRSPPTSALRKKAMAFMLQDKYSCNLLLRSLLYVWITQDQHRIMQDPDSQKHEATCNDVMQSIASMTGSSSQALVEDNVKVQNRTRIALFRVIGGACIDPLALRFRWVRVFPDAIKGAPSFTLTTIDPRQPPCTVVVDDDVDLAFARVAVSKDESKPNDYIKCLEVSHAKGSRQPSGVHFHGFSYAKASLESTIQKIKFSDLINRACVLYPRHDTSSCTGSSGLRQVPRVIASDMTKVKETTGAVPEEILVKEKKFTSRLPPTPSFHDDERGEEQQIQIIIEAARCIPSCDINVGESYLRSLCTYELKRVWRMLIHQDMIAQLELTQKRKKSPIVRETKKKRVQTEEKCHEITYVRRSTRIQKSTKPVNYTDYCNDLDDIDDAGYIITDATDGD